MAETLVTEKETAAPVAEAGRDGEENRPVRVCFVCTGNTCRSPMAEAVAAYLTEARRLALPEVIRELTVPEYEVTSAGLSALEGDPITENAVRALEEAGIEPVEGRSRDYHLHRAHRLTQADAEGCDLLIGMTPDHAFAMLMQFPHLAERIVTMPRPIPDPYGGDLAIYRDSLAAITAGVRELLFGEKPADGSGKPEDPEDPEKTDGTDASPAG